MFETFIEKRFHPKSLRLIEQCNDIINEYTEQGYSLTLRQLYYQLVARDIIPNTVQSYGNIGALVNNARLAGYIDWDAIEDRTRNLQEETVWRNPAHIVQAAHDSYQEDIWLEQPYYVEVWVEKEALSGVVAKACKPYRLPYIACRGYMSQSEQYSAAKRMENLCNRLEKDVLVLHLGDHDPSGMDMTRDNDERIQLMSYQCPQIEVRRIALNMDQIKKLNPPPNPAKESDSRFKLYKKRFGNKSWELDALEPSFIDALIQTHIKQAIDYKAWDKSLKAESANRKKLKKILDTL